jgi:hypothetical protein
MKIIRKGRFTTQERPNSAQLTCIATVDSGRKNCGAVFEVTESDIEKVPREGSRYCQYDEFITCPCCKTRMSLFRTAR